MVIPAKWKSWSDRFRRYVIALFMGVMLVGLATMAAQDRKPPEKIVFPSKKGATTFLHAAHLQRENGECTSCHDKLWPQSTAEPLKSSAGCNTCHKADGKAFAASDQSNCERCHPKDAPKTQ
jgi:c(7)-type cytochrome triheme protein